ncbi:mechanosensitive ion channel [Candidatus Woesearchaeota archaeon]|nr:mechanosensitive ion channel [Candidatus Woesearchaeota archaeon]
MAASLTITRILSAFLILILGIVFGRIIGNILKRTLKNVEISALLKRELNLKVEIEGYLSNIVKYSIYFLTVITSLTQIGISSKVLILILMVFLVIVGIFILLAVKDWIPNILAWFYIIKTQKIKRGETIRIKGIEGQVSHIGLLETKIKTKTEETVFIPNNAFIREEVIKK